MKKMIGIVGEGPADYMVLREVIDHITGEENRYIRLQPEEDMFAVLDRTSDRYNFKEFQRNFSFHHFCGDENRREGESAHERIQKPEVLYDKIRGSLIGGAAGDALGYPVEFLGEAGLFSRFGKSGIRRYQLDGTSKKALISDDTQMTLFTANGLLVGDTRGKMRGIQARPASYVYMAYQDWLRTQEVSFAESRKEMSGDDHKSVSWLADVPELYSRRAPGNTCLSALLRQKNGGCADDYIKFPQNNSKGCGGLMRIAPLALIYHQGDIRELDYEGAEIAAITHGHSLGYMPAAVLTHMLSRIVYPDRPQTLKEIVMEARDTVSELFAGDRHLKELTDKIDLAVRLSENDRCDRDNINQIGEGWVAEEALGISVYCALRHQDDFSAGIIAAVNHGGDSDSTGAVTGNILGALLGYHAIEDQWKTDLELSDVVLELADDLCLGCQMSEYGSYKDPDWERKYIRMRWK